MTLQAIELRIEKPDLMAFITAIRAGDVVGKVGYKKILNASPEELDTLAKFVMSVKALKEAAPNASGAVPVGPITTIQKETS